MDPGRLGQYLAAARKRREGLTLRAVETATGVSNAYLSQLEAGKVRSPSPVILDKLSRLYGISYATVLALAGYPVPGEPAREVPQSDFAARLGPTTAEEEDLLAEYLQFIRKQQGGARR